MNRIKNTLLFLISGVAINTASGQEVRSKIGNNPTMIDNSATLELDSTNKGFLPPRMTMEQRNAIEKPIPNSLMVWCTDCNRATDPPTGQLCVWMDKFSAWVPIMMNVTYKLTTDKAAINTDNSAKIDVSGTLVSISGVQPTETGVVYMEITDNDYQALPVLDPSGDATAPNFKVQTTKEVDIPGKPITITTPALNTTKSYYFRAYARNPFGTSYGNAIISAAPPVFSTPVFTNMNRNSLLPTFAGKLTVNAGTGKITEYGYCSTTKNRPPTTKDNKVVRSTTATLDALNASLSSKNFIANPPPIDLAVNNYVVGDSLATIHFKYYVIVNEITNSTPPPPHIYYSPVLDFTPIADPVTGGTAVAKLITIDPPLKPFKMDEPTSTIRVFFDIIKTGSYHFEATDSSTIKGATTGLNVQMNGNFDTTGTDKTFDFIINGTPKTSFEGNSFAVSKAVTLSTGRIKGGFPAICDGSVPTEVVEVHSKTGRIWMDRNLGASRAAQSMDDYKAYGCLYQWGRGNDGHASINWASKDGEVVNGSTRTLSKTDTPGDALFIIAIVGKDNYYYDWRLTKNDNLWQGVNGINNPCPAGYRIPTYAEFEKEKQENGIKSTAMAFSSDFKFVAPAARGGYYPDIDSQISLIYFNNTNALYFTSSIATVHEDTYTRVLVLAFDSSYRYFAIRVTGYPVRCIKDKTP